MSQSAPPRPRILPLLALALLAACTRPLPPGGMAPPSPPPPVSGGSLVTSLEVETGDTVVFSLQVTNATAAPIAFSFPTGQTFDFAVRRDGAGAELWRWSGDKGFTQAVQTLTLRPGETWRYGAAWVPPAGTRGRFAAIGRLVSTDRPVESTATFALP